MFYNVSFLFNKIKIKSRIYIKEYSNNDVYNL